MRNVIFAICVVLESAALASAEWPAPLSPVISAADGYVAIPDAAVPPDKSTNYREIFDSTQAAAAPSQLLPALNMVGSELNALGVAGVPLDHARFVVVFHGAAMGGLLDDVHYRARFG